MARAATKACSPTPSRAAAARPVEATAQEADESPVRKARASVTNSRKMDPAASEAAAAVAAAAVTGTHHQNKVEASECSLQQASTLKPSLSALTHCRLSQG